MISDVYKTKEEQSIFACVLPQLVECTAIILLHSVLSHIDLGLT